MENAKNTETKTTLGIPYPRGNGFVYYLTIRGADGKKKTWFSKSFPTYEEALADSLERQEVLKNMEAKSSPKEMLSDYLDRWLRGKYYFSVAISTYRCAEMNIRCHINPILGKRKMYMLNRDDVEKMIDGLKKKGLSPSSIHFAYSTLRSALKQAVIDRVISENPCKDVKLPSIKRPRRQLIPPNEVEAFLELAKQHGIYLEVLLGINFGLRRGEVLGLQFRDFDFRRNILTLVRQIGYIMKNDRLDKDVPRMGWDVIDKLKTDDSYGRERIISQSMKDLILALKEKYIESGVCTRRMIDRCFVCCRSDGSFKTPNILAKRFNALRMDAGMPKLRFHDLRHTFASYLIEDGVPLAAISAALGHTSITTTLNSYYDVINGGKEIANRMSDKLGSFIVPTDADLKASFRN